MPGGSKLEWVRINLLRGRPRLVVQPKEPVAPLKARKEAVQARVTDVLLKPTIPMPDVSREPLPRGYTRPVARGKGQVARAMESVLGFAVDVAKESVFGQAGTANYTGNTGDDDGNRGRRTITRERQQEITQMRSAGAAAEVKVTATGGHQLDGNFFSARGSNLKESGGKPDLNKPVVLLLTGSAGSAEDQGLDMAKFYRESGASCLSVNYGGYGKSDDVAPSEQGLVDDAQDMMEYLLKMGYKPDQIVIHGYSLGGAVAGLVEKNNNEVNPSMKLRGAVYDRPMTSIKEAAAPIVGSLAQAAIGFSSTKKAILGSDASLPRVLATDDSSHVGKPGDKLRKKLGKELGNVAGEATGKGHFDHTTMLQQNGQDMLDLVHPDGPIAPDEEDAYEAVLEFSKQVAKWETEVTNFTSTNWVSGIFRQKPELLAGQAAKIRALQANLRGQDPKIVEETNLAFKVGQLIRDLDDCLVALEQASPEAGKALFELENRLRAKDTVEVPGILMNKLKVNASDAQKFVAKWMNLTGMAGEAWSKAFRELEDSVTALDKPDIEQVIRDTLLLPMKERLQSELRGWVVSAANLERLVAAPGWEATSNRIVLRNNLPNLRLATASLDLAVAKKFALDAEAALVLRRIDALESKLAEAGAEERS